MAQPEGNVRIREGEEGDWAHARRVFERGASYRQVEAEVDGRLTYSRIRRMALAEGWTQGEVKSTSTLEERRAATAAATAANQLKWAEKKDDVVSDLIATTQRLVEQVFEPTLRKEVKVVAGGEGAGSYVEVVEVDMDEPSAAEKKALVTSAAILIDKLQLLTGEATSRSETGPITDRAAAEERVRHIRDEIAERRNQKAAEA